MARTIAIEIARAMPAPDKLKDRKRPTHDEPVDEPESKDEDEGDDEAAELSAAEEFLDAIKAGEAKDVVDAFRKLSAICRDYE